MRWVDEIEAAFRSLGGAARYSDLYEYIVRTTDRELTAEWKATVRRTIEDHSSDSSNYRGENLFGKVGHGHWGLRTIDIDESELKRRENLNPQQVVREVLVREHWRRYPGTRIDITDLPDDERLSPAAAWCTNTHLEVQLISGTKLSSPLEWYPRLFAADPIQRAKVILSPYGLHWEELDEGISIKNLLFGTKGIPAELSTDNATTTHE